MRAAVFRDEQPCGTKVLVVDNAFAEAGMTLAANALGSLMLIYADDDSVPDGMFGYEALIAASGPMPDAMAAPTISRPSSIRAAPPAARKV
jgi:hypothetical protein